MAMLLYLLRIDILIKEGNSFRLIEVKAKSYNSMKPEILGARGGVKPLGAIPRAQ